MKKIEAIIREEKLEAVMECLEGVGYMGITVTEVVGLDEDVSKVASCIITAARTGENGDGKIFVLPVENAIRIRTGEDGINAV
jgi:nitrogen regulatory protein P-II 1